jgi:hypothetical protein
MTTTNAWGFDDFPGVDETEIFEGLKPHLAGAEAGEEELFDLEGVQVAVVVERLEDEQVALVESSMQTAELGLSGMRLGLRRKVSQDDRMSWDERPSWWVRQAELSSGGPRFVLRFLRRRPQRIPRTEGRSELELIAGGVRVPLERVCVRRHHWLRLPKPMADSMHAIEPAVRCPTLFLGDRPVASSRSSVGARRAHAVRTLLGMHRPRRGPESGPRR